MSYIDLLLKENDIKLKVVDNGDDTYSLAISGDLTIGDAIKLSENDDGTYIGDIKFGEALVAGENHVGQLGGESISISQTPTVTAGAYSADDAVGGLLTFANAGRFTGGSGVIKNIVIIDDAGQDAELELWLFNDTFTPISDNAAFAPAEADLHKLVGVITTENGTWFECGTPSVCDIEIAKGFNLVGTSLYGQLVTRGTPTFAATDDITVIINLLQD
jgi:hypothetical protein